MDIALDVVQVERAHATAPSVVDGAVRATGGAAGGSGALRMTPGSWVGPASLAGSCRG